jgi:hypothetical protein
MFDRRGICERVRAPGTTETKRLSSRSPAPATAVHDLTESPVMIEDRFGKTAGVDRSVYDRGESFTVSNLVIKLATRRG